jgi:hypothetical protein
MELFLDAKPTMKTSWIPVVESDFPSFSNMRISSIGFSTDASRIRFLPTTGFDSILASKGQFRFDLSILQSVLKLEHKCNSKN